MITRYFVRGLRLGFRVIHGQFFRGSGQGL